MIIYFFVIFVQAYEGLRFFNIQKLGDYLDINIHVEYFDLRYPKSTITLNVVIDVIDKIQ